MVYIGTAIPELQVYSVLDEQVLSHQEYFYYPSHEIEWQREQHIQKDEDLHSAFALINEVLVVSN